MGTSSEQFLTTRWTQVLAAGGDTESRDVALSRLCEAYWQPLYAYVRRRGHAPEEAQDLTQEFFAQLLEKRWLDGVERAGGKFRSFLLAVMQGVMTGERRKHLAEKRGRGVLPLSLDWVDAEGAYSLEPVAPGDTPERAFDRRWAATVLHRGLLRLQAESVAAGKERLFHSLSPFLSGEPETGDYAALAQEYSLSRNGIAAAVKRLRSRYREAIRAEIMDTLEDVNAVEAELQELLAALRP
jgi:DNA-directed RNA polymerase specialized sigma24 family protein